MALTVRHHNYFVEVTPATVRDPHPHLDIPPLPEVPRMPQVAQPEPPSFPWVLVLSIVFWLPLLLAVARGLGR